MKKRKENCYKEYYHVLVDDEYYAYNFKFREQAEKVVKDVKERDNYARVYIIIGPYYHNYSSYLFILFYIVFFIALINLIIYFLLK